MIDAEQHFRWGVRVSHSESGFARITGSPDDETPSFGWLSDDLPGYEPSTLELPTTVVPRGPELHPMVHLDPSDHALSIEQRNGITVARVRDLIAPFLAG